MLLLQDRFQWRIVVNTVISIEFHESRGLLDQLNDSQLFKQVPAPWGLLFLLNCCSFYVRSLEFEVERIQYNSLFWQNETFMNVRSTRVPPMLSVGHFWWLSSSLSLDSMQKPWCMCPHLKFGLSLPLPRMNKAIPGDTYHKTKMCRFCSNQRIWQRVVK
jgi:hypothetical protein